MEGATIILLMFSFLLFHKNYAVELDIISDSQFLTDGDTLVSKTGIFELGIFRPESSKNRYLGIWYKFSVKTVVWVANRDHPVPGISPLMLKIIDPGNLVLLNNISMIWSSNITMKSLNATAKLHDSGNLVLLDQDEKVIWQSFDYPTDTQLPGMKIGKDYLTGIEWRLSSWKSSQDPSLGEFTWGADTRGYLEAKLKQGAVVKYRGGPWRNQQFTGVTLFNMSLNFAYVVVINDVEASFTYIAVNSSVLSWGKLNPAGQLDNWVWVENAKRWQLIFSLPGNICDTYNICSTYGSCSANTIQQSCACLDEKRFVPTHQKAWENGDWSGGCVRRKPLNCKNGSEGFIKYSNVKLPDTENTWFNISMNMTECEEKCLQNCTCMAYATTDMQDEGSGCLIWFNDLVDIRVLPQGNGGGRDIFVKMASSELVAQSVSKRKGEAKIKIIILAIIPVVVLIGFIVTWFCYAWIKGDHGKPIDEKALELPLFSFSTIANATSNFSPNNKLGEGGFGPVYKGLLEDGQEIAVKRLSKSSSQGLVEFKNEVICISKLQHRNLVKLLGCCIQGDEKLLIYEYMPNKSLDSFIFVKTQSMFLDWTKRFNIIKGIARGLLYLHQDSRLRIIHRDVKASNILLDQYMNPKISDFGLARCFGGNETEANTERVVGTYGYMSPEYALDGIFSIKSDVFSFGVLVLEIVSGKKNRGFIHPENDNNLIGHAWSLYNKGRSVELIEARLVESCHPPEVLRSIEVGLLCVQQNAGDRPDMSAVILMLGGESALPQPKQPAFFMERELVVADFSFNTYQTESINELTITEVDAR